MNSELLGQSDHTINDLLKAAYPIIYVLSWEEERVEKGLLQIATERGRKFLSWSTTEGIIDVRRDLCCAISIPSCKIRPSSDACATWRAT